MIVEAVTKHDAMRREEVSSIVRETVGEMLLGFGVDAHKPIELQQDFARLRQWRQSVDTIKKRSAMTVLSIAVAGLLGLLVLGFRAWLGRTP